MSKAMTDSDFFTESDADMHDDVSNSKRGDRKAQVCVYKNVIIPIPFIFL